MTLMPNNDVKSYRDLKVWAKGVELAKFVYLLTKDFPKAEVYGLTSQMRRATVSVPANIAEGHARQHRNEYRQFVHHSLGSLAELDTMRIIALEFGYLTSESDKKLEAMLVELQKMLSALVASLS
jgi:four helix bundle protein